MPRQPLPIGAHGSIRTKRITPEGTPRNETRWEALCRFRDADGQTRRVKATGPSKAAAETALQRALADRRLDTGGGLSGNSRLAEAADRWLATCDQKVRAGDLGPRTFETYESALRLHVLPALGELRLREVTTARCEAWMVALQRHLGPSMCKTSRSVLSGVLGYAARMDAIATNPVRGITPVAGGRKRKPRAMNAAERAAWLAAMDEDEATAVARRGGGRALGDISRFMLATGVRIGEAMAVSWDDVDLEAGTVAIRWHMVRVKGKGLVRLPGAKSDAGDRVLRLPRWAVDMLMERRVDPDSGYPVFPDMNGGWRDPNLIMRWIRQIRDDTGMSWVTSHVWRQTVITVLDEAGLPTREVADQVGHSKIGQTQDYMARKIASERAAEALEDLL